MRSSSCGRSGDRFVRFFRAAAVASILLDALQPNYTAMRLELTFVPIAAAGLVVALTAGLRRLPDTNVLRFGAVEGLKVGEAAERAGWSPRMLRYLDRFGLVVPRRTSGGYRLYGLRELNQLRALAELRRTHTTSRSPTSSSLRGSDVSPCSARPSTAGSPAPTTSPGSSGSSASTSGSWPPKSPKGIDGCNEAIRREGSRPCGRGQAQDRVGRPADAGARCDPRTVRARAAAGRLPHRGVPARHDRDREPHAHAEGGRGGRRAVRVEPALDAGRRRGRARRGVRHLGASRSRARTTTRTTRTSRRRSTTSRTSRWTTAPT